MVTNWASSPTSFKMREHGPKQQGNFPFAGKRVSKFGTDNCGKLIATPHYWGLSRWMLVFFLLHSCEGCHHPLCPPPSLSTTGHCREPPLFSSASFSHFLQRNRSYVFFPPFTHLTPGETTCPSPQSSALFPLLLTLPPLTTSGGASSTSPHFHFLHHAGLGGPPRLLFCLSSPFSSV